MSTEYRLWAPLKGVHTYILHSHSALSARETLYPYCKTNIYTPRTQRYPCCNTWPVTTDQNNPQITQAEKDYKESKQVSFPGLARKKICSTLLHKQIVQLKKINDAVCFFLIPHDYYIPQSLGKTEITAMLFLLRHVPSWLHAFSNCSRN